MLFADDNGSDCEILSAQEIYGVLMTRAPPLDFAVSDQFEVNLVFTGNVRLFFSQRVVSFGISRSTIRTTQVRPRLQKEEGEIYPYTLHGINSSLCK